jgi:nitric oxide reductase subunit B
VTKLAHCFLCLASLVRPLLIALAMVVFGSLIGEFIGMLRHAWEWFGSQGFEYLDLGRFWQILLDYRLFFWVAIIFRGLRGFCSCIELTVSPSNPLS